MLLLNQMAMSEQLRKDAATLLRKAIEASNGLILVNRSDLLKPTIMVGNEFLTKENTRQELVRWTGAITHLMDLGYLEQSVNEVDYQVFLVSYAGYDSSGIWKDT